MRTSLIIHVLAVALITTLGTAFSGEPAEAECVDYRDYIQWSGEVDTPDRALGVAVSGNHAYVADEEGSLQIIVLPFEDRATLETERLERCPNAFVFYDPVDDKVGWVPTCAWGVHKVSVMRRIADYYSSQTPAA